MLYANFTSLVLLHDANLDTFRLEEFIEDMPICQPDILNYHVKQNVEPRSKISSFKLQGKSRRQWTSHRLPFRCKRYGFRWKLPVTALIPLTASHVAAGQEEYVIRTSWNKMKLR